MRAESLAYRLMQSLLVRLNRISGRIRKRYGRGIRPPDSLCIRAWAQETLEEFPADDYFGAIERARQQAAAYMLMLQRLAALRWLYPTQFRKLPESLRRVYSREIGGDLYATKTERVVWRGLVQP